MSPAVPSTQSAVLIVNLGTPEAPTAPAIRKFLREFLSDTRVVPLSPLLWWPVLYGVILPFRPRKLIPAYQSIWTEEGSPLLVKSRGLARALRERLPGVAVALGMRYCWPSIGMALKELELRKPERLVVLPMYPQYSRTTTASIMDGFSAAMQGRAWQPELRTISDYHRNPGYITALRDSVQQHWQRHGRGDRLVMSFHGIPMSIVEKGDPYMRQCQSTAGLLAKALQLEDSQWTLCFQSRIGPAEWTGPYTEDVLRDLGRTAKTLDVICPGFAADCLETLEEISIRGAETFKAAGGEALRYIPALNDSAAHADVLAALARDRLQD